MGKLFKSSSSAVSDPGASEAWGIAKPTFNYVNPTAVDFARGVMENPSFDGQRVAALNPFQINAANNLGGFSNNFGNLGSMALTGTGINNVGFANNFGNNAADLYSRFSGDPTQSFFNTANQYANNPYVDSLIDASSRDVTRNLFERELPGIDRAAAGSGNLNSTRAGVESAIATRGAADRLADMSGQIRSQFFGKGLEMGQNQFNQNLQNLLGVNNQLLNAGTTGASFLGAGQDYASNAFNQGTTAGGLFQGQDQRMLDADKAQFDEGFANRLATLQALAGIGASTKAQTSAGINQTPSILSQAAGFARAFT